MTKLTPSETRENRRLSQKVLLNKPMTRREVSRAWDLHRRANSEPAQ